MASADRVVELFFTRDEARAREIAAELQKLNSDRQAEEAEIVEFCVNQAVDETQFAIVLSGAKWHRGVLGIVASRVVERFGRPTFVLGEENGECVGSGRSIAGFHLLDALESMRGLFVKFGGHSHAAGLTLRAEVVDQFRERLNSRAAALLTLDDLRPSIEIDAVAKLADLSDRFFAQLQLLEPFGSGNRAPVFAAMDLEVESEPRLMKEKHLRVNLRQGSKAVNFKGFNMASRLSEFAPGARIDAAFVLEEDTYNGGWSAILKDVRAH
jgi:single-stranded-DNA-specific exonuclease